MNTQKYFKVLDTKSLSIIHDFFERRAKYIAGVTLLQEKYNLPIQKITDNLVEGLCIHAIGVSKQRANDYLTKGWRKNYKHSETILALTPCRKNTEAVIDFEKHFPQEAMNYDDLMNTMLVEPINRNQPANFEFLFYVPNQYFLFSSDQIYPLKSNCIEVTNAEFNELLNNQPYIRVARH